MCSATQEFDLVAGTTHTLEGYALVHDIAVTENYIIVFQVTQRIAAGLQIFKFLACRRTVRHIASSSSGCHAAHINLSLVCPSQASPLHASLFEAMCPCLCLP